jgi:DNA-directed RNA polymerase subunit RPC12/RpoP
MKYNRNKYLKKKYGISLKQYKGMLKRQGYKCAICGKHQKDEKRNFAVDHCHKTKLIRGILCNYCNSRLLKYLGDDLIRAKGLMEYLKKWLKKVSKLGIE